MDGNFDVIILGTGLTESITAAALAKAGFKVAHLDENSYYGGDEASLSVDELAQWVKERTPSDSTTTPYLTSQRNQFTSATCSHDTLPFSRQYSLSLAPCIIPATGPLISALIASGVSRYGGFRLLDRVSIYDSSGIVKDVPSSKEDIFKRKDLTLVDKRRIMRFLMFAAGEFEGSKELEGDSGKKPFLQFLKDTFSLNEELAVAVTFSLAYCGSPTDPALPALARMRGYLRSAGRYGASPFLIGQYGGLGEIAQGFCRTAAVSGAVYILGKSILSIQPPAHMASETTDERYTVTLADFPKPLTSKVVISSMALLPPELQMMAHRLPPASNEPSETVALARCILVIDQPLRPSSRPLPSESPDDVVADTPEVDSSLVVFPPGSVSGGSTTTSASVLVTGEGSMSAPKGKHILHFSVPVTSDRTQDTKSIIEPYLSTVLNPVRPELPPADLIKPIFTAFYTQHLKPQANHPSPTSPVSTLLVTPCASHVLSELPDSAATNAEKVFWEAVHLFKAMRPTGLSVDLDDVDSLWPPLPTDDSELQDSWDD